MHMRRYISLGLSVALLIVSGAPLVPAAEICGMGAGAMQQQEAPSQSAVHMHDGGHGPALDMSADTCRFECRCSCHSALDSLPHLLAPHAPCVQAATIFLSEQVAIALPFPTLTPVAPGIFTPPPRNI